MRYFPEIFIIPLLIIIPVLVAAYFVIHFAVLSALRKHDKNKA